MVKMLGGRRKPRTCSPKAQTKAIPWGPLILAARGLGEDERAHSK